MDEFTYIVLGGMVSLILAVLAIGRFYPGSGADQVDWKPTRSPETEAELEDDDIAQMIEAQNVRRRRRGEPERTQQDVEQQVAADARELAVQAQAQRAESSADDEDLAQMLEISNKRRRRLGEPEVTLEQFKAELGQ